MYNLLFKTRNIEKSSYIWNMTGSLIFAFQSVIMLMILTRTIGLTASGIFTIAFANANLFLTIGKYGMRNYQVSDLKKEYTFYEYLTSRIITTTIMLVISVIYILYTAYTNNYSKEKSLIIFFMCLFKCIDSFEDIYHGFYQNNGRLDIAAKCLTFRMVFTILCFALCTILLDDLLYSLAITTLFSFILFIIFTAITFFLFKEKTGSSQNIHHIISLLKTCFPLFLGAFLSFYIGNAPKYAIDANLSDELQACYGFISMPVFVIGLLNGFIFNPAIHHMSELWKEKKHKLFISKVKKQLFIIIAITLFCLIIAFFLGIPVLSILYNTNLAPFKVELLILLLGGGFLGISGFLCTVLTIIRFQTSTIVAYSLVALLALFLSNFIVKEYQIMGASLLYTFLMFVLCIILAIIIFYKMKTTQ